jgi:thiaminase
LPLDKFRFFLEQDHFYLEEYTRCLALGAAKSRNERELRYFTVDLNQVLDAEIPNDRELLAQVIELGAEDRGGSLTMAPANVAYTSYLQALALRGGPLDFMAAPAVLVELRRDRDRPAGTGGHNASDLRRRIAYLFKPEVVQMVADMHHDFDELIHEATSDQRWRDIAHVFATSSRLERGFGRWPTLSSNGRICQKAEPTAQRS